MLKSVPHLKRGTGKYDGAFRVLDDVLYDVCRDHPDHTDVTSVLAKLWLIGRTFTTGIERAVESDGSLGSALITLADHMLKNGRQLNQLFGELRAITDLTESNAEQIVALHGQFLRILGKRTRRPPRSFASKYLHFHCRAVPLYDRNAVMKLNRIVPWKLVTTEFNIPRGADERYGYFMMHFLTLRRANPKLSVRELDGHLLAK
jgi:hypothetical protein